MNLKELYQDRNENQKRLLDCLCSILLDKQLPAPILLRPTVPNNLFNGGDIDLLIRRESTLAFLNLLCIEAQAKGVHLHITAYSAEAVSACLISADFSEKMKIDLQVAIRQLGHKAKSVRWEDVIGSTVNEQGLYLLAGEAGAALYLGHARSQKKVLSDRAQQDRLAWYKEGVGEGPLKDALLMAADKSKLPPSDEIDRLIGKHLPHHTQSFITACCSRFKRNIQKTILRSQRKRGLFYLVGCDGVGKTTLAQTACSDRIRTFHIRNFYRKTGVYKIAKKIAKIKGTTAEDLLPRFWFLSSYLFFSIMSFYNRLFKKRIYIVDRSPYDLLIKGRRTEQPKIVLGSHTFARLLRITPIISVVTKDNQPLSPDRDEMIPYAVSVYTQTMRRFALDSFPINYLQFCNEITPVDTPRPGLDRCMREISTELF